MTLQLPDNLKEKLNVYLNNPLAMAFAAYLLGERVAKESSEHGKNSYDILLAVASGEQTLVPTGAELRQKFPETQGIEFARSENQDAERIMANLVIQWIHQLRDNQDCPKPT